MKKIICFITLCVLASLFILGCGSTTAKPDVQYTVLQKDEPKSDPSAWAPGSKRQLTYLVQVPKTVTQDQVKKVGDYLIESDAKNLSTWNIAVFKFVTTDTQSAFMTGLYTKNGKVSDGNQVKPGQYDGFTWAWSVIHEP